MSEKLRRRLTEFIHDGAYAAEVDIEIIYDDDWTRTISAGDARKLDAVHFALRAGRTAEAAKYGRVFKMTPISAK